ncbi:hypothetical protein VTI74DRAFT_4237 [Chaetomium olivicolor]
MVAPALLSPEKCRSSHASTALPQSHRLSILGDHLAQEPIITTFSARFGHYGTDSGVTHALNGLSQSKISLVCASPTVPFSREKEFHSQPILTPRRTTSIHISFSVDPDMLGFANGSIILAPRWNSSPAARLWLTLHVPPEVTHRDHRDGYPFSAPCDTCSAP